MSSSKKSNGRSPLVNPQRQITAFFGKKPPGSSPSPSESPSPAVSKLNPNPRGSPGLSPNPITPSPLQSKRKKPLLVISPNLGSASSAEKPSSEKKSYGAEVVDRRVKVYWPLDKSWYEGVVKSFDEVSGKHLVQYEDAEEERLDLSVEKIEWIEEPAKKKLRRLRRFSVLEEDDDDGGDEVDLKELEDDSDDEDWDAKAGNGVLEDEECLEDLDLEVEEEESGKASARKTTNSRKRKVGEGEGIASKKGKNGGELKNSVSKLSSSGSAEKLIKPNSGASPYSK